MVCLQGELDGIRVRRGVDGVLDEGVLVADGLAVGLGLGGISTWNLLGDDFVIRGELFGAHGPAIIVADRFGLVEVHRHSSTVSDPGTTEEPIAGDVVSGDDLERDTSGDVLCSNGLDGQFTGGDDDGNAAKFVLEDDAFGVHGWAGVSGRWRHKPRPCP